MEIQPSMDHGSKQEFSLAIKIALAFQGLFLFIV